MMPISNYRELIQILNWDKEKREKERWYVFLVMNPRNQTNAGIDIIKNFSYLDARSENVALFLPGFSNQDEKVVPYRSEEGNKVIYEDDDFGRIYFDEKGFLETIEWLEKGCCSYRYSEDLDLVVVRYYPRHTEQHANKMYGQNFDLQNMIVYNLDRLKKEGVNVIKVIMECRRVVSESTTESEITQRLDNLISGLSGDPIVWHNRINVFVAGALVLERERDAVISALTHIANNSTRGYSFCVKTFEDFPRMFNLGGSQELFNDYIQHEAEFAIFILDSTVGGVTYKEFNIALQSYLRNRRPKIYVYSRLGDKVNNYAKINAKSDIQKIREQVSEIHQYYIEYSDISDLKYKVSEDFRRYSL